MKWLIYKHTSPSGKVYIGQTMQENPQVRWQYGNGYKSHNTIFYKAIKKYGWNNFSHEIIENDIMTQCEANEREIFWISYYNSYKDGYNSTPGGNCLGDNAFSKPVAQIKIDNPRIIFNQYKSAEDAGRCTGICSRNIGACCLKQGQITAGGYYWCYLDEFEKFNPPEKKQGKVNLRKVYCFETGLTYNSIKEASLKLNISKDGILACCKNRQITAGDCHFCYYEDIDDYCVNEKKTYTFENYIYQIEIDSLKIIKEFLNYTQASQYTGISRQQIGKCVNGNYISAGGFYWCKKNDWHEGWSPNIKKHSNAKGVFCIETEQYFESLADASKITGINLSSISECCNKKLNTAGNLHWCFYDEFLDKEYVIPQNKSFRKIICIETKETFDKIQDAVKKYNLKSSNLSFCLTHPSRTCGGFHWSYLENFQENYVAPQKRNSIKRKVLNIDKNEIFNSIREASKIYNICESNINRACRGNSSTAGGYHWKYIED